MLDCNLNPPGFDHPDLSTCGKRFKDVDKLDEFIKKECDMAELSSYVKESKIRDLRRLLEHIARAARSELGFGSEVSGGDDKVFKVVRYVSCKVFADHFISSNRGTNSTSGYDEVMETIDDFIKGLHDRYDDHKTYDDKSLNPDFLTGLKKSTLLALEGSVVWVTGGSQKAPHKWPYVLSLDESERAAEVVRL
ncbi:MAG: hypothetical protein HQK89_17350 [Nitrospirae bacterium]|nr:hypothetical protein [Nitrospirota bacterium]